MGIMKWLSDVDSVVEKAIDRKAAGWLAQMKQFTDTDERLAFVDHLRRSALAREDGIDRRAMLRAVEWIEEAL